MLKGNLKILGHNFKQLKMNYLSSTNLNSNIWKKFIDIQGNPKENINDFESLGCNAE